MPVPERRQRWAAFSVRAHRDLASLAADILLYDRIILPVPEDEPEYDRWVRNEWNPDDIALRTVQAAGRIIPVPWTAKLRREWKTRWDELKGLGREVAFGLTGAIYASYPPAWAEIRKSLDADDKTELKPAIFAGYQSAAEAKAELGLTGAGSARKRPRAASAPKRRRAASAHRGRRGSLPGGRPIDLVVAMHIRRLVHEPAIKDPEEAFLAAVALAENSRFQRARRSLFDWEDRLFVDDWKPAQAEKLLRGLEEEYRDAVRAAGHRTRKRYVATLLPKAAGWGVAAAGYPQAKSVVSKSLSFVLGRFIPVRDANDPLTHPGAALDMIRAAYRNARPEKR